MKDNNLKERILAYSTSSVIDTEQLEIISGGSGTQASHWTTKESFGIPPSADFGLDVQFDD